MGAGQKYLKTRTKNQIFFGVLLFIIELVQTLATSDLQDNLICSWTKEMEVSKEETCERAFGFLFHQFHLEGSRQNALMIP